MAGQESESREKSEFNMAVSYLNRLNVLFCSCDSASMQLDVYHWFHSLLAIFRELSTEMKDAEIIEWQKEIDFINSDIGSYLNSARSGRGKGAVSSKLYLRLHNFELFLRSVLKSAGLQQRMMDDPNKSIG